MANSISRAKNITAAAVSPLTAQWKEGKSNVTFNANGGSVGTPAKTVQVNDTYGDLPTPTRDYHTFLGWYTAETGGSKVTSATTVSETTDHTLYAHWQQKIATVTLNPNGGSPTTSATVYAGSTLGSDLADTTPTRTGYTFAGWWTERDSGTQVNAETIVPGTVTYYAHWTGVPVTATLNYGNGETNGTLTLTYGGKYTGLSTPTRAGYTFTGWGADITADTVPTASTTYTAVWKAIDYAANVNGDSKTINVEQTYSEILPETEPAKEGYAFDGWQDEKGIPITPTERPDPSGVPKSITPKWTANQYTVTFAANSGSLPAGVAGSMTVTYDQPYGELPVPTRSGFNFVGWTLSDGAPVTAATIVKTAGDHALTAQWAEKPRHKVGPDGEEVEFTALTQAMFDADPDATTYELSEGNYYLAGDITTTKQLVPPVRGTVNICFNGHTFTCTGGDHTELLSVIRQPHNATFVLNFCDCQGNGGITNETSDLSYVISTQGQSGATINLYGGTFKGKYILHQYGKLLIDGASLVAAGTAINAQSNADVTIKSGSVTSGDEYGTVYIYTPNFTMTGGVVANTASSGSALHFSTRGGGTISGGEIKATGTYGQAIYFYYCDSGTLTLSGSPVIEGGQADIGFTKSYEHITVGEGLTGNYTVYYSGITETNPFAVTTAADADYSAHFTPAVRMTGIGLRDVVDADGKHTVQLYRKHLHSGQEYENYIPLTADTPLTDGGRYLLTGALTGDLTVSSGTTVDLCLNGYTLTGKITVDGTLNLYDCKRTGKISSGSDDNAILVNSGGVLNYYGGTLEDSDGIDVVHVNGVCNLYAYPAAKMIAVGSDGSSTSPRS